MRSHPFHLFSGKVSAPRLTWFRQWPFWLTFALNSIACLHLTRLVYKYQTHPFDGDEVNHALPSLRMAYAFSQHAWLDLVQIIYTQSFYPPAAAVVKALSFILFEPSILHARLFSVVCLFLAVLVLYALCVEIDSENGGFAGLVAAMLTLSSSSLLINAGLSMVEIPGLLVSLLFLWAYIRTLQKGTTWRFLMVSFIMIAVFLTKYTYGIVLVLTLGLTEGSLLPPLKIQQVWPTLKTRLVKRWIYLFGPFALATVLWFFHPEKIEGFVSFTQPLPGSEPWLSLQNVGSYLHDITIHNLPSPFFAAVAVGGMVWAVHHWSQRLLRPLLLYFFVGVGVIMVVNHPVNTRFMVTFVPALHVLTGLMIGFLWRRHQLFDKRILTTVLLGFIGLSVILSAPNTWRRWTQLDNFMEVMVETDPAIGEMMIWIQQQIPPGQPVFLVNYWDQLTPNLFTWYQGLRHPADIEQSIGSTIIPPPTDETLASVRRSVLDSQAKYLILFEGGPWGQPFWPEYTAALEDMLVPVAQHEFTVTSVEEVQTWLDANSVTDPAWLVVRDSNLHNLSIGVVVYRLEFSASFSRHDLVHKLPGSA